MTSYTTIHDLNLTGKKVLLRADLNLPLDDNGEITDANRLTEMLPTLNLIREKGGIPIVMSHLGRPAGFGDQKTSLRSVAKKIQELTKTNTILAPDCIGEQVKSLAAKLTSNDILVLENLRWQKGEKNNDQQFAKELASLGEVYINDAFATAHRADASMDALPRLMKQKAIGLLMQKELDFFAKAMLEPKRPLAVVLGGAKISSKFEALVNISSKADKIIIGGAMANTFLAAQGVQMGRSLVEASYYPKVLELMVQLARKGTKLYIPVDFVVAPSLTSTGLGRTVTSQEVPADTMALDIGPATSLLYKSALYDCETIVWNGPMGAFENPEFSKGTTDMIETIASAHGLSVVGGGDTDAAIHQMQLAHKFGYISTGGGAFLELLEGKTLVSLQAMAA
jgi:phosphoglycerate kinase